MISTSVRNFRFGNVATCLCVLAFLFAASNVCAQNNYTRVAAGFNYVKPRMGKGYSTEPWKGVNIRSKVLELGYYAGHVSDPSANSLLAHNAYVGLNIPIRRLGFGKREYGIKGILVAPFIAGDVGRVRIGDQKTWQLTVAPGVSLQLPYVLVDFRLNTIVGFSNVPGLTKQKYMIAPTVTLQFDALWDVMDPELRFDANYSGIYRWTEGWDYGDYVEYTTFYKPYSYDVYRYNVGAHISLGPRVSYWNLKNGNNKTLMIGLVQSGRANNFGYDLIAEQGKIITEGGQEVQAVRTMGRLSMNLNVSQSGVTQFTRLMIGGGIGYNWFTKTNPYVHSKSGEFFNLFASLEFGAVGFSYEQNFAFYNRFDDQKYFSFTYRVPIERVVYRYRQLKSSR